MSDTTVFVDDAVSGQLPMVCVRTGAPADGLHRISRQYGGLSGWAFLLLFLGPIGLVVLIVLALTSRSRQLTVRLPYSRAGIAREGREFRAAVAAFATTVLLGTATAWLGATRAESEVRSALFTIVLVGAAGALIATVALAARFTTHRPGIDLDASGRWVTLRGVSPTFAAVVRDEQVARRIASGSTGSA